MSLEGFSIVFSAPSGAGKSTIIKRIMSSSDRFQFAVSTTTRDIRQGETHGAEYYFVDKAEFLDNIEGDDFVEWAKVHNNYYGTSKKEIDRISAAGKIPVFDVDVQGARSLREVLDNGVFIFILPPSLSELENRLRTRNTDSDDQINIRLDAALCEMKECSVFDYVVINNLLEDAVNDVQAIVRAESLRVGRMMGDIDSITGS